MGKELQKRKERRGNTLHVDVNRLKGKTLERGMTGEEMAKELGISQSTYYRKLGSGGVTFTLAQTFKIADILNLSESERIAIFFAD